MRIKKINLTVGNLSSGEGCRDAYLHLHDQIYVTFFEDQLIAFDISKDQYMVFSPEQSRNIAELTGVISRTAGTGKVEVIGRHHLFKNGFFNVPERRIRFPQEALCGSSLNDWQVRKKDISKLPNFVLLFKALSLLKKVHRCSNNKRIRGLVDLLTSQRGKLRCAELGEFDRYILAVDIACMLYPKRTKCLEWTCTLMLLGAYYGLCSTLVIGVQNKPFSAHAWVESKGKIIGDSEYRREQFAPIYELTIY